MRAPNLMFMLLVLNIISQAAENVGFVHWFTALGEYGDGYWILVTCGISYCMCFVPVTVGHYVYCRLRRSVTFSPWPTRQLVLRASAIGLLNALNGFFVIYPSDPTRTPPLIQQVLFNAGLLFTVFWNVIFLGHSLQRYRNVYAAAGLAMILCGSYVGMIPLFSNADLESDQITYSFIFLLGTAFGCGYNVMQKWYLEYVRRVLLPAVDKDEQGMYGMYTKLQLLSMQVVWMTMIFFVGFWTDFIPFFGFAPSSSVFSTNGGVILKTALLPWNWGLVGAAGAMGAIANIGYLVSFWCSLLMNNWATTFTAVANQLVPVFASIAFKLIPGLDPSGVNIGWEILVPSFLMSAIGAILVHAFEKRTQEHRCSECGHVTDNTDNIVNEDTMLCQAEAEI